MRKLNTILLILFLGMFQSLLAQRAYDVFDVKDYRNSVILSIENKQHSVRILSDYGQIVQQSNNTSMVGKYAFQAQEYETDLELYLFPSRLYSPVQKRFIQPDPKSQFASPYVFVGSDPINMIDKDGNVAKPLILHGLENGELHETGMMQHDAYNYSLSDFMQNKIPDMAEWDGNIYVSAHMYDSGKIVVERQKGTNKLLSEDLTAKDGFHKSTSKIKNPDFETKGGGMMIDEMQVDMDADLFGTTLKKFSEERGVQLKNVVMGGCEGGVAAEQAADAFESAEHNGSWMGEEVNFFGPKKGYYIAEIAGPGGMPHTTWTWLPKDAQISASANGHLQMGESQIPCYTYTPYGSNEAIPAIGNPSEPVAEDLLYRARVSATAQGLVDHIPVGY